MELGTTLQELMKILEIEILGNPLKRYLLSLGVFIVSILALKIFERVAVQRLKKLAGKIKYFNGFCLDRVEKTFLPLLYAGSFYLAVSQLSLNPGIAKVVHAFVIAILTIQVTRLALSVTVYFFEEFWVKRQKVENVLAAKSILTILRFGAWALAVIFMLDNMGFNISTVIAGLGIGGVAVALAAQTILGDLFNYFVIFFDRPFVAGDSIVVGDLSGTIEHIGIKTTRIRSVSGEQIVLSNTDLTSSRIRNFKRMAERRVVLKFGVIYETSTEKLRRIPELVREIVSAMPQTRLDRSHFCAFADSSLDFETVYYVLTADYNIYMDIQQKINLRMKEAFEKERIEFAHKAQALFLSPHGRSSSGE